MLRRARANPRRQEQSNVRPPTLALAATPLMLNVMSLTWQDRPREAIGSAVLGGAADPATRGKALFDAYLDRVFSRKAGDNRSAAPGRRRPLRDSPYRRWKRCRPVPGISPWNNLGFPNRRTRDSRLRAPLASEPGCPRRVAQWVATRPHRRAILTAEGFTPRIPKSGLTARNGYCARPRAGRPRRPSGPGRRGRGSRSPWRNR